MAPEQARTIAELLRRSPTAQRVLRAVKSCPLTVAELAIVTQRSEPAVRLVLRLLRAAGLVRRGQEKRCPLRHRGPAWPYEFSGAPR